MATPNEDRADRIESVPPETKIDHPLLRRLDAMRAVPPGFTSASTFSIVACALARRLTRGEALRLVEALPAPLAPLLAPCTEARDEAPSTDTREELHDRIAARLGLDHPQAELVARAVLRCIRDAIGEDHARHIESQLPEDLADLWRLDQTRLTEVQGDEKPRRVVQRAARGESTRHG